MKYLVGCRTQYAFLLFFVLLVFTAWLPAQTQSGSLQGRVTDPTGAIIPNAALSLKGKAGPATTIKTNGVGEYQVKVPAGTYTITVRSKGFSPALQEVEISAGKEVKLDFTLQIPVQESHVTVEAETGVDASPDRNINKVVVKGKDLEAFADDPDELAAELQELAGAAAGPNGGQIYVDGFLGGQLPPKASIREIRVNQNPFSSQYDKLGYGRIEIFTKPGTDQFHGQFSLNANNRIFNARNPFVLQEPDYNSELVSANLSGPLNKKASFFVGAEWRDILEASAVNAVVLDSNFNPVTLAQAVSNPRNRINVNPRLDYQLGANDVVTLRYQFTRNTEKNDGIGQFALLTQAFTASSTEHTLQASETHILSAKAINEARFEYQHDDSTQTALDMQPQITVPGAFTGGGNNAANVGLLLDHYDLQNYTSLSLPRHFVRFGARLRATAESSTSRQNFNGTFTFDSLNTYRITEQGLQQGLTMSAIRALGGGPSQFTMAIGNPLVKDTFLDLGLYAEDDWRIHPNLTLSYGLRFETQSDIHDRGDFAPRLGLAWGIGGSSKSAPKMVVRAGFGIFYDRFTQDLVLLAKRLNGANQTLLVARSPDFFPTIPADLQTFPTVYRISPDLRAPYTLQTAVGVERQFSKGTVALTYYNARGVHQLFSSNVNAPLPGTFDPSDPASGVRPLGNIGNVFEYESDGIFKQNQLMVNFNLRAGSRLSFFGFYAYSHANSNTGGPGSFTSNPFDLGLDYGRAAFDIRHRAFAGGNVSLPYGFSLSPLIAAHIGRPFNITVGRDLNGDSIFNDRPAFATDLSRPSVVVTRFGAFDTDPLPGQVIIPPNFGTAPAQFTLNLRVSKVFSFGKRAEGAGSGAGGGDMGGHAHAGGAAVFAHGPHGGGESTAPKQKYNVTISSSVRNIFNIVNVASPVGVLSSPLFGQANALAGGPFSSPSSNRRIDLQILFSF